MKIRGLIHLASCFLLLAGIGCGNSITGSDTGGSNTQLSKVHTGGPDCAQSSCHPGFGAAGTVFDGAASLNPVSGVTVKAKSAGTGEIVLGISDSLGNFYYDHDLNGYFNMSVDGGTTWSDLHNLPATKGCNSCHKWPGSGKIFYKGGI